MPPLRKQLRVQQVHIYEVAVMSKKRQAHLPLGLPLEGRQGALFPHLRVCELDLQALASCNAPKLSLRERREYICYGGIALRA